jgi:hypothetical protein
VSFDCPPFLPGSKRGGGMGAQVGVALR